MSNSSRTFLQVQCPREGNEDIFFQYWRQSNLDLQTDIFEDKSLKLILQKLLYNDLDNAT